MTYLIIAGVVVFFVLVIWSMKRHRDPTLRVDCDASIDDLIPSLAGLTLNGTAVEGNSVEIFENGAFFDVLVDEIARRNAPFTSRAFCGRRACWASASPDALSGTGPRRRDRSRAARCERLEEDGQSRRAAAQGSRVQAGEVSSLAHPQHRRDERARPPQARRARRPRRAASAATASSTPGSATRRTRITVADVSVRLRGPIVHSVQAAFSENWVGQTGELFMGDDVFPQLERAGPTSPSTPPM